MTMAIPAIEFKDVHFSYGEDEEKILHGVSFPVMEGEIFGFLGPNGAGKTTAFKVLVGLLTPMRGQALINGVKVTGRNQEIYRHVGYMPVDTDFHNDFTVREFLHFFGRCYGLSKKQIDNNCDRLLADFRLEAKYDRLLGKLSTGEKQRVCLMRAMVHDPHILILDEPASGLDPGNRKLFWDIMGEKKKEGTTILISSHILPELAGRCGSIGFIQKGRMRDWGEVKELLFNYQHEVATYRAWIPEGMERAMRVLQGIHHGELHGAHSSEDEILDIRFHGDQNQVASLVEMLVKSGARLVRFEKIDKDIETIYAEILGEQDLV